ncbi:hypothetical protein LMANV2_60124 [Leptospira interrogans serovar Manilae]|uniref:Uncharacterized protein n=1 Tax=Leptospira interrogans serovar Manilae TaxID=214675 RepID=A0AAQ1P2E9_LEPIR|nr:hypothetical protein LMANV2_60124 [Leptospira interrogans serovar Manilae]
MISNAGFTFIYYSDISKQYYLELVLKIRMWYLPQKSPKSRLGVVF